MKLTIDLSNVHEIAAAITFLRKFSSDSETSSEDYQDTTLVGSTDSSDDLSDMLSAGGDGGGSMDDLDSLMNGEETEPEFPSVDDLKRAFKSAIDGKGKDATLDFTQKVFKKLKVKSLAEIAEDKRQNFIDVMDKFAKSTK